MDTTPTAADLRTGDRFAFPGYNRTWTVVAVEAGTGETMAVHATYGKTQTPMTLDVRPDQKVRMR